jgi:hypothetical protein
VFEGGETNLKNEVTVWIASKEVVQVIPNLLVKQNFGLHSLMRPAKSPENSALRQIAKSIHDFSGTFGPRA